LREVISFPAPQGRGVHIFIGDIAEAATVQFAVEMYPPAADCVISAARLNACRARLATGRHEMKSAIAWMYHRRS
jgi:hypothetical protein